MGCCRVGRVAEDIRKLVPSDRPRISGREKNVVPRSLVLSEDGRKTKVLGPIKMTEPIDEDIDTTEDLNGVGAICKDWGDGGFLWRCLGDWRRSM